MEENGYFAIAINFLTKSKTEKPEIVLTVYRKCTKNRTKCNALWKIAGVKAQCQIPNFTAKLI